MKRRIISMVLALVMVLGMIPWYAAQAEAATSISLNRPLDQAYTITAREYYSSGSYHGAIDYGCPKGTPVYAAESGTVTVHDGGYGDGYYGCKDGSGWGNYIDISHGNGYSTRYAHMSTGRFVVTTGTKVQRGQLIGYSGNSGNSTGPHLHFGLYLNGSKVYPEPYITTATGYFSNVTTHTVDSSYTTNFTAYPKAKITAENILDANHNQISSTAWIGASDECTIHEVYTDGCCKVTYPLDAGSTKTVYSKISLFNVSSPTLANLGDDFIAPILNKEHWKIIENSNGIVQTADETGTANQLWRFERQSDGSYKISSCLDGRCLDVADGSSASEAKVWVVDSNDTDAQRWYIYEESGGYVLKAKCTDCVLDLPNIDPTNGNQLQMYTKNGTAAQIWAIYLGDECKLTSPTLSVSVGDSGTKTVFTWNEVYGERCYDVKIWKDTLWEGDAYHLEWGATSGYEIVLPAGTYHAYVDAGNHFECKMSNVVTFTVAEHKHDYTYKRTERPTVKAEGMLTGTCSSCGSTVTITLPKLNTTDYTFEVVTAPSCTTKGTGRYTWNTTTYGTYYFNVTIDITDHSYTYAVTKAPTASATGTLTGTCSECSGTTTVTLPKLNTTDYTYKVVKEATCTANGTGRYTWKTTTYGSFYFDVTISKTGHSYTYKVTKTPTTSATGTLTGTCSRCSGTTTVTLPKLNTTDYTYKVTKEPSYTATGTGRYTWNTTTYGTFYFDVTLDKLTATLAKIEVASKPTKTVYEIGESLDTTGLALKATYSDGSAKTITSGFTTSGFDSSTAGEKTVTVSYGGKSTSFKVTVEGVEEVDPNATQIVVESATASCGSTVEIDVEIVNNPGFSVLNVAFIYDTEYLTLLEVENHLSSMTMTCDTTVVWDAVENYTGNGVLCTLKFEIAEDAPEGEYEIQVLFISASNDEFEELNMSGVSGTLEICNILYGDVNGDGKIASVDLAMLRKYLASVDPITGASSIAVKAGADCNGDGKITSVDLAMLRKYLASVDPITGESTVILGPR